MKEFQVLEHFFEKQHRQWKKEIYSVFQKTSKEYGFLIQQNNRPTKNKPIENKSKEKTRKTQTKD